VTSTPSNADARQPARPSSRHHVGSCGGCGTGGSRLCVVCVVSVVLICIPASCSSVLPASSSFVERVTDLDVVLGREEEDAFPDGHVLALGRLLAVNLDGDARDALDARDREDPLV